MNWALNQRSSAAESKGKSNKLNLSLLPLIGRNGQPNQPYLSTLLTLNPSTLIPIIGTMALLAPTGALVVMMVYYISAAATHFFRFSLSPLMQLMLQVSLYVA